MTPYRSLALVLGIAGLGAATLGMLYLWAFLSCIAIAHEAVHCAHALHRPPPRSEAP